MGDEHRRACWEYLRLIFNHGTSGSRIVEAAAKVLPTVEAPSVSDIVARSDCDPTESIMRARAIASDKRFLHKLRVLEKQKGPPEVTPSL